MRVAVIAESFLPHVNGVTNSVLRTLEHLHRRGHEALVLAPGEPPTHVGDTRVVSMRSVRLPGYPQVQLGVSTGRSLAKALADFAPDVMHLASPFTTGRPALRAAQRLDLPTVAVFQTDVAGFAARYGFGAAAEAVWLHLRAIHERADLTLAPSPSAVRDLTDHQIPRVQLWQRGVDTKKFHPRHRNTRLRRELAPGNEALVGFIGRLAPEKQVADLAVLQNLPGVRVVVVGDGPDRDELRRILPNAHFTGLLTGHDLSQITASLDVAVQTGPFETFCQAAQEAMASGLPVVGVGTGGVADLIDHSRSGWTYAPGNLDELRTHVHDLVGDEAKRLAMGRAARASVLARTWDTIGDQLLEHYSAAIRQHATVSV